MLWHLAIESCNSPCMPHPDMLIPSFKALLQDLSLCVYTGMMAGYLAYDCLHYALHHWQSGRWVPWLAQLRRTHLRHHFVDKDHSFGISSPLVDVLLGSLPPGVKQPDLGQSHSRAAKLVSLQQPALARLPRL